MHLGPTWSHFRSNFHKNNGRQWPESENERTPKAAYRRRMARAMYIISPCVRPKRAQKQNYFPRIFEGFLKGQEGHGGAKKNNDGVGRGTLGHFGFIRGSLLDTLESLLYDIVYMRVTLESLRSNFEKH